jgi:hypothetical protein
LLVVTEDGVPIALLDVGTLLVCVGTAVGAFGAEDGWITPNCDPVTTVIVEPLATKLGL